MRFSQERSWQSRRIEQCMETFWSSPSNSDAFSKGCPVRLAGVSVPLSLYPAHTAFRPCASRSHRVHCHEPTVHWPSRIALPSTAAVRMHDGTPPCAQRSACPQATRSLLAAPDGPHRPFLSRRPPPARRPGGSTPAQPEHRAQSMRPCTTNSGGHPPKCSPYFLFRKALVSFKRCSMTGFLEHSGVAAAAAEATRLLWQLACSHRGGAQHPPAHIAAARSGSAGWRMGHAIATCCEFQALVSCLTIAVSCLSLVHSE